MSRVYKGEKWGCGELSDLPGWQAAEPPSTDLSAVLFP